MTYYNDADPFACAWLRELIAAGEIPEGTVDERPIQLIKAKDLEGYRQCHFFGGIAGWPLALRLAGWPSARPVWTASCPCQPFSVAGKGEGEKDERHLWPVLLGLVRERRPPVCFGEQVSSRAGYEWLARVRDDLEAEGYAVGCADLPACSQGSPHIRQRLFWVATRAGHPPHPGPSPAREHPGRGGTNEAAGGLPLFGERQAAAEPRGLRRVGPAPDPGRPVLRRGRQPLAGAARGDQGEGRQRQRVRGDAGDGVAAGDTRDAEHGRRQRRQQDCEGAREDAGAALPSVQAGPPAEAGDPRDATGERRREARDGDAKAGSADLPPVPSAGGFWDAFDILDYRDGKRRRVEPGSFPLAHGVPAPVVPGGDPGIEEVRATTEAKNARLRGYGNAIVPQVAAAFIRAFLEAERELAQPFRPLRPTS